jgi:UDP-N-acetyl-D-glucosamine dehydrogenase
VILGRIPKLTHSDPHVPRLRLDALELSSDEVAIAKADCVVIVTDHSCFDYRALAESASLIVDTRNALKGIISDRIIRI